MLIRWFKYLLHGKPNSKTLKMLKQESYVTEYIYNYITQHCEIICENECDTPEHKESVINFNAKLRYHINYHAKVKKRYENRIRNNNTKR